MRIDIEKNESGATYLFEGDLNEQINTLPTLDLLTKVITLDLDHVHSINSFGVKSWLEWSKIYAEQRIQVCRLRPTLIRTINVVAGFLPKDWAIQSFYVPYVGRDENVESVLFIKGKHFTDEELHLPPRVSSSTTDQKLILDVNPDFYLKFLKNRNPNFNILKVE